MSGESNADLVATYARLLLDNRAAGAVAVLVVFEHLITFKYEIDFLWSRKWGAATWIFVLNRYFLIANVLSSTVPISSKICGNTSTVNFLVFLTVQTMPTLPLHAFTILRGFALLQNHTWRLPVTCVLVALAVGVIVCNAYEVFVATWQYTTDPILGSLCYQTGFSVSLAIIGRMDKAGTVFGVASGAIVLIVTWVTTARQVLQASSLGLKTTLSQILLRDGSMFFLLVLLYDIHAIVLNGRELSVIQVATILLVVLPQILLSRFIINLRQADAPATNPSDNSPPSRFSIPNFRMPTLDDVVGNLGEPLDFVEYCVEEDEDGEKDAAAQDEETDSDGVQRDLENVFKSVLADVEAASLPGSGNRSSSLVTVVESDDTNFEDPEPESFPNPALSA